MKRLATVLSWLAVIFCFLCLPTFGFHVCNIFFVLAGILFIPDGKPSRALGDHLKIKPAFIYLAATALLLVGAFTAPFSAPDFGAGDAGTEAHTTVQSTAGTADTSATSSGGTAGTTQATHIASSTAKTTPQTTTQTSAHTTAPSVQETTVSTTPVSITYILNTKSKKIHYPGCYSAKKILDANRAEHTGDFSALLTQGYTTCGICFK